MLYWNVCDKEITRENQNQCLKWARDLHDKIELPRSKLIKEKQISYIDIHLFSDVILTGVFTVAYAVINQQSIFSQNLIASKSRLGKNEWPIPRVELVAAHM